MRIILDTNFLLLPARFGVDIFAELDRIIGGSYELFSIEPVMRELRGLARGKGKNAGAAKVGLQLAEKRGVTILKTPESDADKAILELVRKDFVVATQDTELRKKVSTTGGKVIYLRAKQYLVLV
jgi:rRNA-processing protein FCF1